MALFPRPLCDGLVFLRLWLLYSSSPEKVSLGGVLDLCLYVASSVSSEEDSDPSDDHLRRARHNFFFSSSISRCMSLSFFVWETLLFPRDWLLLVCVVCTLPSWFVEGSQLSYYVGNPLIPPGADYHYPDVARLSVDANLILPFSALNQNLLLIRSSLSNRRRQL